MSNKKAIILLSGGLDSVVSIAKLQSENIDFALALTFDYGQKSATKEINSSKEIADYYNIEHKVITLDWLKEITNTSLVSSDKIPELKTTDLTDKEITQNGMKSVWVPNRNGLFINIAASYADSFSYDYVVIGANKEEAETFSDNSEGFINNINKALKTSTNYDVEVIAPLINLNKNEIVKTAIELKTPLNHINSCYNSTDKHCGKCESCSRLKRALENQNLTHIIKELFE